MPKISELPDLSQLSVATYLPLIKSGTTYKMPISDLRSDIYIDPHLYGAKGDAVAAVDGVISGGTSLSSPTYQFVASDVGKLCFINENERTITAVAGGVATLSAPVANGTTYRWLIGTDDTAAIENAMIAAKTIGVDFASGLVSESGRWGSIPFGGTVVLRSGHGYLVRNTQVRYDAGKLGAVTVPRRCGLKGGGISQTHIYLAPGNIGHGVANENAGITGWDDFMTLSDFSLFGNHDLQGSGCLDGIYFNAAFNNYLKVDNFMLMENIRVFECKRNCYFISGRGEGIFSNLFAYSAFQYGFHIYNHMDSRFYCCNAGGCLKTGMRLEKCANDHFTNCKSFYNGASGGTGLADSANFALIADSYLNGQVLMTACESQESRGSGFYITSGLNIFNSCLAADPGREPIGSDPRPAVMAGFHIAQANTAHRNAKHNFFNNCVVRPSLTLNYGNPDANNIYCGTHAVYIDDYCLGNKGNIWTFDNAVYTSAKYGGTGTTNGKNTGLRIDNVANFAAAVPSQVTGLTATAGNTTVSLSWTAPYFNGAAITDYLIEYKLSSEPTVWTTFSDGVSSGTSATVTGLTNGSSYDFRVSAINSVGTGTASATSTTTPFVSAPSQVTGLTATPDMLSMGLSWTAPSANNSPITDYLIEYKLASEPTTWTTWAHTASTATTAFIVGLTSGQSYNFRVSAINAIGTGTASATSSGTPTAFNANTLGAALWIDMSDGTKVVSSGGQLVSVTDKTANADVMVPSGTGGDTTVTTNGLASLLLTSSNDIVLPNRLLTLPQGNSTVLCCASQTGTSGGLGTILTSTGANYYFGVNGGSNRMESKHHSSTSTNLNLSPVDDTNTHMMGMRRNSGDVRVYYGSQSGNNTAGGQNTSPTALKIGGSFGGKMNEFIILPFSATDNQIEIVKSYFATKWGAV